jgi:hypothetical protein
MYELKVATKDLARAKIVADPAYRTHTAFSGGQTIFATDSADRMADWDAALQAAGVRPLGRTREDVDPSNPDTALVKKLADLWEPTATRIEDEFCVGFHTIEPTAFVRAMDTYLYKQGGQKARHFNRQFFGPLE